MLFFLKGVQGQDRIILSYYALDNDNAIPVTSLENPHKTFRVDGDL